MQLRPSIEKMIISNTLLPISFALDILAFIGMVLTSLKYLAPDLTRFYLSRYPRITCSLFTSVNAYLTDLPLAISISVLIIFRALRQNAPSFYNHLDHDTLSLVFYASLPASSVLAALLQLGSCGHVCRYKLEFYPF